MWRTEWSPLAARVEGLVRAHASLPGGDPFRVTDRLLIAQTRDVADAIVAFVKRHEAALPAACATVWARYDAEFRTILSDGSPTAGASAIVVLSCLRHELEYFLHDRNALLRSATERAFEHLQRLIVVDATVRATWQRAFAAGEVECEKLGAVHLLWHGIWGFKSDAAGEKTDLVLGERVDVAAATRSASGLVLTEWKVVRVEKELLSAVERGEHQAKRYASGSVAALELRTVRYIVCVSKDHLDMPPDRESRGVTYRHVNIAVDPTSPSVTKI
jgi:hypothetical protein